MEHKKKVTCVVCPALAKKAKKKLKEQQRLQHEIDENHKLEMQLQYERLEKDRRVKEERLRQFREEELERERITKKKKEIEAERAKLLAMEKEEEENLLALEREEARLLQEARDHAAKAEAQLLRSMEEKNEDEERLADLKRETSAMLAAQHAVQITRDRVEAEALLEETKRLDAALSREGDKDLLARQSALADRLAREKAKQKDEEMKLMEETRKLEALETQTLATRSEYMKRDLLEQEHRRRLVEKAHLDEEIAKLEEARRGEEQEVRRLAEERRAEEEARMIAALEADAAAKALAAEEAIRKAKQALQAVSSTKRDLIAQTIALAEKEAIAETEKEIMREREDHKEKVIIPTESELYKERWETLRMEGRAIMTRRVLQGWQLLPSACKGKECEASPLITKNGRTECAVCGGCGNGEDGVYAAEDFEDVPINITTIDPELMPYDVNMKLSRSFGDEVRSLGNDEDFDKKRDMVSKEIGKRMLLGWTLMDASCPDCVMPLMMDNLGNTDICVLCGPLNPAFDASTIKSREMASLDEIEDQRTDDGSRKNLMGAKTDDTIASVDISATKGDDLLAAIRERASRERIAAASPKPKQSDPPAFTKGISTTMYENALADSEDSDEEKKDADEEKKDDEEHIERAVTADEIIKKSESDKDAMSTDAIAKMFLRSPHGYDFHDIGADMTLEEVKELVDIFMATNFNEKVPDDFKYEVAREILDKSRTEVDYVVEPAVIFDPEPSTTPTSCGIINLENMPSPPNMNFHFQDFVEESTIKSSKSAKRREKPTPETIMASTPSKSPRPPRAGGNGRREGAPIIVGGPLSNSATSRRHQHYDNRSTGGMSRAESVASEALDSIYVRIEECKKKLMDPKNSIQDQLATADLMEKLAKAAVAMKAMETLEQNE
jgi:uncharacterized Zn finger protein (UPF0148 family)